MARFEELARPTYELLACDPFGRVLSSCPLMYCRVPAGDLTHGRFWPEPLPSCFQHRDLLATARELQRVRAVKGAAEFCELLHGRHRYFKIRQGVPDF